MTAVFLDVLMAFDTTSCHILLMKCEAHGIRVSSLSFYVLFCLGENSMFKLTNRNWKKHVMSVGFHRLRYLDPNYFSFL